ncbi:MAG TPA: regulatory iron-sulfur-containing complex subunit RicT [Bacteroidia bacterium]|nr:regulatory iron-sulfur-containing complex subunit RicT [Bacteroidia bacterium]
MGCSGCSSGRGCGTVVNGVPAGCRSNGSCGIGGCNKLNVFDWLANMELPSGQAPFDVVEVRFKNSRKEFFRNVNNLPLVTGEVIAVEGSPGHDIGTVSLTGELVKTQMARRGVKIDDQAIRKVYRKAKENDVEKWKEAQALEQSTMMKSREIAQRLGLQMKISDVEFQGDKTKAIFYYTAEERVDFRELIKILAEQFRIRIEMRQIGARQEAARLGGIGSCGRELCCSTWLSDFRSVTTSAARYQQLSLNPLKLAGQCGKLKCCLNYELDSYLDAIRDFPETADIETSRGRARHQKTDIFRGIMWYSFADEPDQFIPLSTDRVKEIIKLNKEGVKPEDIGAVKDKKEAVEKAPDFENVVGQDSLTRFDKSKKKKRRKPSGQRNTGGQPQNTQQKPQQKNPQQKQPRPQQQKNQPRPNNPQQQNQQKNNPQRNQRRNRPPRPGGGNKPGTPPAPKN